MTKAALQTSKLGRCSRTRNVEKKLQLRMLQLRLSPHVTGPPKEPGGLTSVVVADVPEPVLRSGLISQTPLLSIRSELVWREMSLCCELQMLSGSVCRSGIEWGSGKKEWEHEMEGGRREGGLMVLGFFSFLFFSNDTVEIGRKGQPFRARRVEVSLEERQRELWYSKKSFNPVRGSSRNKAHTRSLTFSSRFLPACPGKSWSTGRWQMADPEPWPTVRSAFWGANGRYQ